MQVLHVNWAEGALRLWSESLSAYAGMRRDPSAAAAGGDVHPFAVPSSELARGLIETERLEPEQLDESSTIHLRLPGDESGPRPSDRLSSAAGEIERAAGAGLATFAVPAIGIRNEHALAAMLRLEDRGPADQIAFGHSLPYWIAVVRFVLELLVDQRFIPTVLHPAGSGTLRAAWQPWLHDDSARQRLGVLLAAMPPVVRAVAGPNGEPWHILREAVETMCDATARLALAEARFIEAIEGRDPADDPQVAWLSGLLDRTRDVAPHGAAGDGEPDVVLPQVRSWLSRLEDADRSRPFRLCFGLTEPPPQGDAPWHLAFHLLLEGDPPITVAAEWRWDGSPTAQGVDGHRIGHPQEHLLAELGRASRIYPKIESALSDAHPVGIELSTEEAAQFLREHRQVLEESGFGVMVPQWWGRRTARLGVRLLIDSSARAGGDGTGGSAAGSARLGLDSLVRFRWQLAIGDDPLTAEQLQQMARSTAPLIRIADRWVENPGSIAQAADLIREDPGGEVTLRQAIRMAQGADAGAAADAGLPVLGMDARGWVGEILELGGGGGTQRLPSLDQPRSFEGSLRPYQKTGLSWLSFLERFGFGACLADDMGLGKTIQLIALLLLEREAANGGPRPGTTLLVVPTSLIENWARELKRFAPSLTYHVHHGPQRLAGEAFTAAASGSDLVITTYALVPRDRETMDEMTWWRVVLDEAQFIKNPPTQQAVAIRNLRSPRRVALTGTPVENRLTELWSIMEFCNPGYLGPAEEFRRRCAVPIERHRDRDRAEALRQLVHPFVLRRLKTDPRVIVDLPPCLETKEFATLTSEQAAMYQAVVDDLLATVDEMQGIQRRGRVLAALTRLKQICNHPDQLLTPIGESHAAAAPADPKPLSSRSGKCTRLMEMLEELLAAGGKALVFTQYRRMGQLLSAMIRQDLDCDTQFMHGGTVPRKRQEMIDRFQSPGGSIPVFILSLKTGGIGLNLTAANHVFHFDRWWNPAVENQATDRAFRIGQTRTVHVHKFVCAGTLEERIDQMIEQKMRLADNIISSGEQWLTELSTKKLHEILELRATAMEVEA